MGGPRRAGVVGPLEEYADGFAADLSRQGYVPRVVELQGVLLAELSVWMGRQGLDASGLSVAVAERFMAARRDAGRVRHVSMKSLGALFDYLRGLGVTPLPSSALPADAVEEVLGRFGTYLRVERGLAAGTICGYVAAVRPFVAGRLNGNRVDLSGVTAADVSAFIVAVCPARPPGPAKVIVSAMRSLLGFLYLEGTLPVALAASVPSVASWRLARLPRPLSAGQVRALLDSCDRRTGVGHRDFAMLVVLSRLGCVPVRSPAWAWTTSTGGRVRSWWSARDRGWSACRCRPMLAKRSILLWLSCDTRSHAVSGYVDSEDQLMVT